MKKAIFHLQRDGYERATTLGTMTEPEGKLFGQTLEDIVRPDGIKCKGWTAIPETKGDDTYFIDIRISPRFGEVAVIYTRKEEVEGHQTKYILEYGGIRFDYILIHGANTHQDVEGCIGIAKRRINSETIQGTLKKQFTEKIKQLKADGFDTRLRVTNLPQAQ